MATLIQLDFKICRAIPMLNLVSIVLSIFLLNSLLAQGNWVKHETPTSYNLKCLYFLDSLKGWVAGDSGIIMFTSDGGNSWQIQNTPINYSIHNIHFLNEHLGWALSWRRNEFGPIGTTFLKTTNGGSTWIAEDYGKDLTFLHSIFFQTPLIGWVCGEPGTILKTTDGGVDWSEARISNIQFANFPIVKLKFFDNMFGLGCGGIRDIAGVIWVTSDGGNNWDSFPIGPEPILDFQILDTNFVVAVGGDYEYGTSVSISYDKGLNWIYRTLDIFGIANSVAFKNFHEGWLNLIGERKFLVTMDTGWTWSEYPAPDSVQPNQIVFTDSLHGYAVCDSGYILKYRPPFFSKTENSNSPTKKLIRFDVFPNPFNSITQIVVDLPSAGKVELELFDILGRKLKAIFSGNMSAGAHRIDFNAQNLSTGIYLLRLKMENLILTKKIILIR